jgi:biopolymer transport protein ExbB
MASNRAIAARSLAHVLGALLAALLLAGIAATLAREAAAQNAAESSTAASAAAATDAAAPSVAEPAPAKFIATDSLFHIVLQGGWLMIPLIASSFLLTVFTLERLVALRGGRVIPRPFVKQFLHEIKSGEINRDEALEACLENDSPVAKVFAHAVRKWGKPAVEVEQAILDGGERVCNDLRKYLRVINGISTVSPLLGLLGTVTGMIAAFNNIASSQAMGRPELLAAGISEALITTAAGLSVAIPAMIFYMFFVGRVDQLIVEIDALGQELVHLISAEAGAKSRTIRKEAA